MDDDDLRHHVLHHRVRKDNVLVRMLPGRQ
jgi:cytochrome b561